MRLGVIADVHANLSALRRALDLLDREGVDDVMCLGDLVGYGPQPNEVVDAIAERNIRTVAGNHDLVAAGIDPMERSGAGARATLEWTRDALSGDARAFLAQLPRTVEPVEDVVAAHGSLDDPWRYVRRTPDALEQIGALTEAGRGQILLVGHTHRQMAVDVGRRKVMTAEWVRARTDRRFPIEGPALINPGAVGQSREPRALVRFALLDMDARIAHLYAVRYDSKACRDRLRALGLPPEWCHPRPTIKKTLRQVARDAEDRRIDLRPTHARNA